MSQQALDLRRSVQILRRRKGLMGLMVALGLLAGGAYAALNPPMLTSTALVLLPQSAQAVQGAAATTNGGPDPYITTQEVIASSNQVLAAALPHVRPAMSLAELRDSVKVGSLTPYIVSITAEAKNAANAEATANAVANNYISYIGATGNAIGHISAQMLQPATTATGVAPREQIAIYALVGALGGALIGVITALAVSRADRRLGERDEIANSIGVPVIASFPVRHPGDAAGWTKLLENYKPEALHALQLRRALQHLGMAAPSAYNGDISGRFSFAVLCLSSDPGSFALGPQLAVFAASQGIPTALVIGPQQEADAAATLRTACTVPPPASSKRPSQLHVTVSDNQAGAHQDAMLTVVVVVVDGRSPRIPATIRTNAAVIGVSAGAATADQLARVAVSAASDGREITGILMADPDPADPTTGRLPQLARPGHRRTPTRMTGITTEIRK